MRDFTMELSKYNSVNNHPISLIYSCLPPLQYYLSAKKMVTFDYTLIIKVLIT